MGDWHSRPVARILEELESGPEGLTEREASRRLERVGPNQLDEPSGPGMWRRVLEQLRNPMILVLLGAAVVMGTIDWRLPVAYAGHGASLAMIR